MENRSLATPVSEQLAFAPEPSDLRLYVFQSNPARRDAYFQYYKERIIPWLKAKGVTDAKVWTVERNDIFIFAIACSPVDPPWDDSGIPELVQYLDVMSDLRFTCRTDLGIPPN